MVLGLRICRLLISIVIWLTIRFYKHGALEGSTGAERSMRFTPSCWFAFLVSIAPLMAFHPGSGNWFQSLGCFDSPPYCAPLEVHLLIRDVTQVHKGLSLYSGVQQKLSNRFPPDVQVPPMMAPPLSSWGTSYEGHLPPQSHCHRTPSLNFYVLIIPISFLQAPSFRTVAASCSHNLYNTSVFSLSFSVQIPRKVSIFLPRC